ncbi:MAG: hypothetical protein IKC32_06180 [Clostridia bacterium]|nr:hypothetical protein [Clostridia bacterium]
MIFNVNDYGAVADGVTLNSKAVQAAVDACALAGGGTVLFGEGDYVLATVFMKSGVTVEIPKGTRLLGSLDFYDYAPDEKVDYPLYQDVSHSYFNCSMFVARGCENIAFTGGGVIDMRSVWDEDNVRNIVNRGPKTISLLSCKQVTVCNLEIYNSTDLAVYFTDCEEVEVYGLKMRVYIDGVSPDNSKNVRIHDCEIEAGDDAIVFKSSYNLNRVDVCRNIHVWNCKLRSRCSSIKFGTETNGGFENILIENIMITDTRITGIAIESVDGAIIDGVTIRNVTMENVNAPLFIHIGKRMRGPEGREIGRIRNVTIENVIARGPYHEYEIIETYYRTFKMQDHIQYPWVFLGMMNPKNQFERNPDFDTLKLNRYVDWQMTSNCCGLEGIPLENITLRNFHLSLDGGCQSFDPDVPDGHGGYPEVYVYGKILPAKGIYFRHIDGLTLENITVDTERPDVREPLVFSDIKNLNYIK